MSPLRPGFHLSFEFFPPRTEKGEARFDRTIEELVPLNPEFVSVTFGAGGSTRETTLRTVEKIARTTDFEAVPHLSCIGSRREEILDYLGRYRDAGLRRIVALRGDIPEGEEAFCEGGFRHASELVSFIREFGGFEIHVGCYPEFHPETPDPERDMAHFAHKVSCGADVAITQYFFQNAAYYRFVDDVRRLGVEIPIVVGLMPITHFAQIDRFSTMCGADIPLWIRRRMEAYADDVESQRQLGVEIATAQVADLLEHGVPGIHFYTLNKSASTIEICRNLGLGTEA